MDELKITTENNIILIEDAAGALELNIKIDQWVRYLMQAYLV